MPAAVLLIKAAQQWQQEHDGQLPGSYAERSAFKDLLKSWQRHIDGIPLEVGGPAGAGLEQSTLTKPRHAAACRVACPVAPVALLSTMLPAGRAPQWPSGHVHAC